MSPRGVEGALARIYRKLNVGSRAELANTMAARRFLPPPPDNANREQWSQLAGNHAFVGGA